MSSIDSTVSKLRDTFTSGRTRSYAWRIAQLQSLQRLMKENEAALVDALNKDLGRHVFEASGLDLVPINMELAEVISNLKSWMQPVYTKVAAVVAPAESSYIYEPYGVVLIIGAFNYPINLTLMPLIGAIAAGNAAVIKPSEISVHCETVLAELLPKYLDNSAYAVITGGIPVTTALLEVQWDKIFFTGSGRVGKIVMSAAAKHLTPVSLELGGKSPTYIDSSVTDMALVCRRVLWGKMANAGQTCIAPDYILVHAQKYDEFIAVAKETLSTYYGSNPKESSSFARIVTSAHAERLAGLLQKSDANVVCGGDVDVKNRYVAPTLLTDVKLDSAIMQEEIFGPLLPIIKVQNVEEAISIMRTMDKPLALYLFGKNRKIIDLVINSVRSGGVCVNDTIFHIASSAVPFGGVGPSGLGGYHGKFSFEAFSHRRTVLRRDDHSAFDIPVRYPPYTAHGLAIFKSAAGLPALPHIPRRSLSITFGVLLLGVAVVIGMKFGGGAF